MHLLNSSFPLVSVVIPTYNQAAFLSTAIDSVLNQTYSHLEILIIDDGSTDHTPQLLKKYTKQDSRIKSIRQHNQGPSAARNLGIIQAKGTYLCLLDSDDIMHKNRVEYQLALFKEHPNIDIVYTALQLIDINGSPIGELRSQDEAPANFLVQMFFRNIIPGPSTIMAKRSCLVDQPYNHHFKHAEDYELMLRLAHHYRFKYLDLPLTSYRRHLNNLSNDLNAHRQAELKVLSQYTQEHIAQIISQSSLSGEEKILMQGRIAFNREMWQEALTIFEQSLTAIAFFYRGNCHFKINQIESAIQAYRQSLELDATNPACYNNLGLSYACMGQREQALSCFKKALSLKKGYLDAQDNLSQIAREQIPSRITLKELRKDLIPYHS